MQCSCYDEGPIFCINQDKNIDNSNLRLVYGELEQAKDYYQRALEIQVRALGPTHVQVGTSYNNLDLVFQNMGELE